MADLATTFRKPFAEQVAALRLRLANQVPTARWDDLWQDQHDRAFMVAGALKADLLEDLAAAVDRAAAEGTGFDAFRRDFREIVERRGWHGWTGEGSVRGEEWRMRTIYRTNMRTSYMAGRHAQLVDGGYKFWVYRHSGAAHPRLDHLSWDGVALPPDHPFWATHYPPNGWGCGCVVYGARSERGIRRVGGDPGKALPEGWQSPDPRTGAPRGVGRGWAYAPGASVSATTRLAAEKIRELPAVLGADLGASVAPLIARAWPVWLADTLVKGNHQPALAGTLSRDILDALSRRQITPRSAGIMVQPGLLSGPIAARDAARSDALSVQDWLALPWRLQSPEAVLLDERTGRLLYILRGTERLPQLAIDVSYMRKGETDDAGMIVSAYRARGSDLLSRIVGGLLSVLVGGLG